MRAKLPTGTFTRSTALLLAIAGNGCVAGSLIQQRAQQAAQDEARQIVGEEIGSAIQCDVDDAACTEDAQASGEEVVYVDDGGEVIADDAGAPIRDRDQAIARSRPATAASGVDEGPLTREGALFFEDYAEVPVGEFPAGLELVEGSWDVVEAGGRRYLRVTSDGAVKVPLPEVLPDRFTVEFDVSILGGDGRLALTPEPAFETPEAAYAGSALSIDSEQAGVIRAGDVGPWAQARHGHDFRTQGAVRFQIVGNGEEMEVHVRGRRASSVPNAIFPRTDAIHVTASGASENQPTLIGPIRIGGS